MRPRSSAALSSSAWMALDSNRQMKSKSSVCSNAQDVPPRQWVAFPDGQREPVRAIRQILHARAAAAALGRDADIGRPVDDRLDHLMAEPLAQFDVDVGMGHQIPAQHVRDELVHGGRIGIQPDAPLDAPGVFLDLAAQVIQLPQHGARMLHEHLARRGQRHPLAAAIQQVGTQGFLEALDPVAGGGHGQEGAFGAFGQAHGAGHVHHQLHIDQVKASRHGTAILRIRKAHLKQTIIGKLGLDQAQ